MMDNKEVLRPVSREPEKIAGEWTLLAGMIGPATNRLYRIIGLEG